MKEIWKIIPRFNGYYEASNYGNIRSLFYNGAKRKNPKNRVLRIRKDGYSDVNIFSHKYLVHLLVWEAFYGPVPPGFEINHVDMVRSNNRLDNLNLLTRKANCNWGDATIKKSRPVLQLSYNGETIKEWSSEIEAHRQTGISQGSISNCCIGRCKTAGKYTDPATGKIQRYRWKYVEQ